VEPKTTKLASGISARSACTPAATYLQEHPLPTPTHKMPSFMELADNVAGHKLQLHKQGHHHHQHHHHSHHHHSHVKRGHQDMAGDAGQVRDCSLPMNSMTMGVQAMYPTCHPSVNTEMACSTLHMCRHMTQSAWHSSTTTTGSGRTLTSREVVHAPERWCYEDDVVACQLLLLSAQLAHPTDSVIV
jgi:hypothetical protein